MGGESGDSQEYIPASRRLVRFYGLLIHSELDLIAVQKFSNASHFFPLYRRGSLLPMGTAFRQYKVRHAVRCRTAGAGKCALAGPMDGGHPARAAGPCPLPLSAAPVAALRQTLKLPANPSMETGT